MDFQEINRIVLSLLNSFGGGAVVVGVLSGWLGKIQANRIHEKDKYGFQKSLNEIKEVLNGMSLYLGMEIPNWPPDNIAELSKKLEESI